MRTTNIRHKTRRRIQAVLALLLTVAMTISNLTAFGVREVNAAEGAPSIYYVNDKEESLTVANGRNWDIDPTTSPAFLIYDIEGYEYLKTVIGPLDRDSIIRPILRRNGGVWQYTTSVEDKENIRWDNISGRDIYVVYKEATTPSQGGTPVVKESENQEDPVAPAIHKSSKSNEDGTNTIGLSITADTSPLEVEKLADVIVIVDISNSMNEKMTETSTRLDVAKTTVKNLANSLIGYKKGVDGDGYQHDREGYALDESGKRIPNFVNSKGERLIEMSLISFSRSASQKINTKNHFTSDYSTYESAVNALSNSSGTNWEEALKLANNMAVESDRATFVIFLTDGNPSYRVSRGNLLNNGLMFTTVYEGNTTDYSIVDYPDVVSDQNLDTYGNANYQYRKNSRFGKLDENDVRNFNTTLDVAKSIVDHNKNFYSVGIGKESGVSRLRGLTTYAYGNDAGKGNDRTKVANSADDLTKAFSDIAASIVAILGWGDITMTDGITSLANTVEKSRLVNVDGNFEYWKAPAPEGWDNWSKNVREGYILGTSGEEISYPENYNTWEPAEKELYVSAYDQGKALVRSSTDFSSWDPASENCNEATYDTASGSVKWDMGHNFVPEAGCTYKVTFRVWPSQEAYDILANLKNGAVTYDSLPAAQKEQIVDLGGGNYSLKTNDKEPNTTYKSARKTGDGVTTAGETKTLMFNDVDPMELVPEKMSVKKVWTDSIDVTGHRATELKYRLLVDGQYYQTDGTFADKPDNKTKVLDIKAENRTINVDGEDIEIPAWTNTINIAPGIVVFKEVNKESGDGTEVVSEVYETGHEYSLEEFDLVNNDPKTDYQEYQFEFISQTVRPMVLTDEKNNYHAELVYLILVDENHPAPEGVKTYKLPVYDSKGNVKESHTYYVGSTGAGGFLSGTNFKTSELDITKVIDKGDSQISDALLSKETFTYRVTLRIPADANIDGIMGYNYFVYKDGSNAPFPIYGYQPDDKALATDIERFGNRNDFRSWNALNDTIKTNYMTIEEDGTRVICYDVTITNDQVYRFTSLPMGTEYTIEELYANYYPASSGANPRQDSSAFAPTEGLSNLAEQGYKVEKIETKTSNQSETEKTVLRETNSVSGIISTGDTRYYNQFTNRIGNVTTAELKFIKKADGYVGGGERYYFKIKAETATYADGTSGTSPLTANVKQNLNPYTTLADGNTESIPNMYSTFGKIRFTQAGKYTYRIFETDSKGNDLSGTTVNGIAYGKAETVIITVENDNNGYLYVESITGSSDRTVMTVDPSTEVATGTTTITNKKVFTEATVQKVWNDANNFDGKRPESLTVTLKADGKDVITEEGSTYTSVTLNEGNKWTATVENLPKYAEGKEIVYTWIEDVLPNGYTLTGNTVKGTVTTLTNTYTPVAKKEVFTGASETNIDGQKVVAGQELTYKITYANTTSEEQSVTITDSIPTNTTFVEGSANPEITRFTKDVDSKETIIWENLVPANSTVSVSFKVKVNDNTGTPVTNEASVVKGNNTYETNTTSNPTGTEPVKEVYTGTESDKVNLDGKCVEPGQELTYAITYTNTTGKDVQVTITDKIAEFTSYVDGSVDHSGRLEGNTLTWVCNVPKGEAVTVTFKVKVNGNVNGETITNQAELNDGQNSYKTNVTEVHTPTKPDKEVFDSTGETIINGATVGMQDELTYRISYTNTTGRDVGVVIEDEIPEYTNLVEGSISDDGIAEGRKITWRITVPKGETKSVSFKVKVADFVNENMIENTATVRSGDNQYTYSTNTVTLHTRRTEFAEDEVQIVKLNDKDQEISGAAFTLFADDSMEEVIGVYEAGKVTLSTDPDNTSAVRIPKNYLPVPTASGPAITTMYLVETVAPQGYIAAGGSWELTVKATLEESESASETEGEIKTTDLITYELYFDGDPEKKLLEVTNSPWTIDITKIDADSKEEIEGAEFALYDQLPTKDNLDSLTPLKKFEGGTFRISMEDDYLGGVLRRLGAMNETPSAITLYLLETKAPDGYEPVSLDNLKPIPLTVWKDAVQNIVKDKQFTTAGYYFMVDGVTKSALSIENKKKQEVVPTEETEFNYGFVTIQKVDESGRKIASKDVTFTLYADADKTKAITTYTGSTFNITTDITKDRTLAAYLPKTGETQTLYLAETAAPEGYELKDQLFEVILGHRESVEKSETVNLTTHTYTIAVGGEYETLEVPNPSKPTKTVTAAGSTGSADGSKIKPGDELTYTVTYINGTEETLEDVVIADTIPTGTTYVADSARFESAHKGEIGNADGKITWTVGSLGSGETLTVSFKVTVNEDASTAIDNTAEVKIGNDDPVYTNKVSVDPEEPEDPKDPDPTPDPDPDPNPDPVDPTPDPNPDPEPDPVDPTPDPDPDPDEPTPPDPDEPDEPTPPDPDEPDEPTPPEPDEPTPPEPDEPDEPETPGENIPDENPPVSPYYNDSYIDDDGVPRAYRDYLEDWEFFDENGVPLAPWQLRELVEEKLHPRSPKTGDAENAWLWMILMAASMATLVSFRRERRTRED